MTCNDCGCDMGTETGGCFLCWKETPDKEEGDDATGQ